MGRPIKLPNERKESKLFANCTNEEYEIIQKFAKENGYNISLLIRIAVLDFIRRETINGRK